MLKLADASQTLPLLFLKTTFLEQVDSSLLQMKGCNADHQRQLASNGSAAMRLAYIDLAQLDQHLNSMDRGVGLQPGLQGAKYTADPAALWHMSSSEAAVKTSGRF